MKPLPSTTRVRCLKQTDKIHHHHHHCRQTHNTRTTNKRTSKTHRYTRTHAVQKPTGQASDVTQQRWLAREGAGPSHKAPHLECSLFSIGDHTKYNKTDASATAMHHHHHYHHAGFSPPHRYATCPPSPLFFFFFSLEDSLRLFSPSNYHQDFFSSSSSLPLAVRKSEGKRNYNTQKYERWKIKNLHFNRIRGKKKPKTIDF